MWNPFNQQLIINIFHYASICHILHHPNLLIFVITNYTKLTGFRLLKMNSSVSNVHGFWAQVHKLFTENLFQHSCLFWVRSGTASPSCKNFYMQLMFSRATLEQKFFETNCFETVFWNKLVFFVWKAIRVFSR